MFDVNIRVLRDIDSELRDQIRAFNEGVYDITAAIKNTSKEISDDKAVGLRKEIQKLQNALKGLIKMAQTLEKVIELYEQTELMTVSIYEDCYMTSERTYEVRVNDLGEMNEKLKAYRFR